MKRVVVALLALLSFFGAAREAHAHGGGASYVELREVERGWQAQIDLPLPDLAGEFELDADGDALLRWSEVLAARGRIEQQYRGRLVLRDGEGGTCTAGTGVTPRLVQRPTGKHLRIGWRLTCSTHALQLDASRWVGELAEHGVYVVLKARDQAQSALLVSGAATLDLAPQAAARTHELRRFLALGAIHLVTGYDHLAFLGLLLLGLLRSGPIPAAAAAPAGDAPQSSRARELVLAAARIVTAFTLAHSLTLALAATELVRLPSQPVEIAIAASIVVTAIAVLARLRGLLGWRVAFVFGLIHGFGFAGLLAELLPGGAIAGPLLAFNLGLELAQLGLVLLAMPLLLALAARPRWSARLTPALAAGLAGLGSLWLLERL